MSFTEPFVHLEMFGFVYPFNGFLPTVTAGSAFLDQIADWLINQGVVDAGPGGPTGWQVFKSYQPPSPDQTVTLYETPGEVPEIITDISSESAYDFPGLQVRLRGTSMQYSAMRAQFQKIYKALHEQEPTPVAGQNIFITLYSVNSGPMPMGLDEENRPEATWNFRTMRSR